MVCCKNVIKLCGLEQGLRSGHQNPEHEKRYARYFDVHQTTERGIKVTPKEEATRDAEKDFGYFALLSNGIKDPVKALHLYRSKDLVEKTFGNLKEKLSMRRMSAASEENFEGKLFTQFVALVYLSCIKKVMEDYGLFKSYTIQSLLDDLDNIEWYRKPGKQHHLSEITEKQKRIYGDFGFVMPSYKVLGLQVEHQPAATEISKKVGLNDPNHFFRCANLASKSRLSHKANK